VNLHRLDLVSLSLFAMVVRTGSISKGAALANLAVGAASKRMSDLEAMTGAVRRLRHARVASPCASTPARFRPAGAGPVGLSFRPPVNRARVDPSTQETRASRL